MDGDLDLVCGNIGQSTLYLSENGTFQTIPAWTSDPASNTRSLALLDIDGDGDLDLICGNYGQSNILYLNDGGTLRTEPAWSSGPANSTYSVALGDVDGDGDLDLICGNYGQSNILYLNDGGTLRTEPAWSSGPANSTYSVALGDVDGDGDLDLACGNYSVSNVLYLNNGGILEINPSWSSEQTNLTTSVALGDADCDGDPDFICGNCGQRNMLFLNTRVNFDTNPAWWSASWNSTYSVALGDIDGDSDLDLACGNYYKSNVLYLNTGGTFETTPAWSSKSAVATHSVVLGDIDTDGDLDLVCGNISQSNMLYRNIGGTFDSIPAWSSEPANDTRSVVLGDLDGDGDLDLVCGNMNQRNTLYLNAGGTFGTSPAWSSGPANATYISVLRDTDSDGDLDLVCGNIGQSNELYLNVGGTLQSEPTWLSGPMNDTRGVALGDVDGDGDLDLVCGNAARNTLYLNAGGSFQTSPIWSPMLAHFTFSVALRDIDADGDLDLVCGNYGEKNMLYLNDGGIFEDNPAWSSGPENETHSITLGDVDGDGDLDLVCGNTFQGNTLYRGEMAPVFKGDLISPRNHLPNNSAYLRFVGAERMSPGDYRISVTTVDVESDPIWFVPEYQYEGDPTWHPAVIGGRTGRTGPFETSPAGVSNSIVWDTHLFPFDARDVILRLRVIEIPKRVSVIQHVAPYLKEIGPVTPYRPVIATANGFTFPAVTLGDTTFADVHVTNEGTAALTITNVELPTTDMRLEGALPIHIAPGGGVDLRIYCAPGSDADIQGSLVIDSDDPFAPSTAVELAVHVRPLEFAHVNLYPGGEVLQGTQLSISVVMQDSVHVDSARVFYRQGGEELLDAIRLQRIDDPVNEQYYGLVPAGSITARGIEYYVGVYNGCFSKDGSMRRLRARVKNLDFAAVPPAKKYIMVSLPLEMEGPILGVLSDDLGGRDITKWRMWGYDCPAATYVELPNDTITHFEVGRGYWLIARERHRIDTGPAEGLSTPTEGPYEIALEPGWNMIGNPFCFPVAWDSVHVDTLAIAEAEGVVIEPPVRWEVGTGYSYDIDILQPFEGYWVKNLDTIVVTLHIPPREAPVFEYVPETRPAIATESNGGWYLSIRAGCGGAVDHYNLIGMVSEAGNGHDALDRSEPPLAPGRSLSLYFPHTSWERHRGNYTVDVRGSRERLTGASLLLSGESSGEGIAGREDLWGGLWRFDVAKSFSDESSGDEVTLEFEGLGSVPAGAVVYLVDRHLQRLVDLRLEHGYRFFLGERGVVSSEEGARFVLLLGSEEFARGNEEELPKPPVVTALHQNYPNPFNPATVIHYDIDGECEVEIRIYDARGALVKTIYRGRRQPGRYEIGWNGSNNAGGLVASGIYFCCMTTSRGYSETRKMLIIR